MNPSKSGWLTDFIAFRKQSFKKNKEFNKTPQGKHPDQSFYGIIQPTGIMYGHPVNTFGFDNEQNWSDEDGIKVLMADSFFNISELYSNKKIQSESDFDDFINLTLIGICDFYNGVYPEIGISSKNWLGKKKNITELTEQILEKRVLSSTGKRNNFWLGFFSRSQLFLDIYIYGQWTHIHPDNILLEFFKGEKEELSFTSVKVIAAAAHANRHIEQEERALFEHFIATTSLPAEKRRVAQEYFEHGMGIQEIPIQESDSWIIRKFFLELAILTIWSDKKVDESERVFLKEFNDSLGFSSEEFEESLISVEGFLLQNWSQLDSLQGKIDYDFVSSEYINLLINMCANHINRIENMVADDNALLATIRKGNSTELTEDDKQLIRSKFLMILQSIPNFRVVVLPDEFLNYDTLLRIIPKDTITKVLSQN
jgi:hypothetical protein